MLTLFTQKMLVKKWYTEKDFQNNGNGGGGDGPGNNTQTGIKTIPGKEERNCFVCSSLSTKA